MVTISILFPNKQGARFDLEYYVGKHMPLARERLGRHPGFKAISVERGVSGVMPGTRPDYIVMGHLTFDSFESFIAAFTPYAAELKNDMRNFTDIAPQIQFNQVLGLK
jgi:uncharacterized protein (TIGR02118 family)